jgi:hypothetical protein
MEELDRIKAAAIQSIGRACLFGLLAIGTTMFALISWPILAFRSGAILSMLMLAVLLIRSEFSSRQDYRRTETWLLMGQRHTLPESHAARVILGILRDTYRRFAVYAATIAVVCWALMFLAATVQPPEAPRALT